MREGHRSGWGRSRTWGKLRRLYVVGLVLLYGALCFKWVRAMNAAIRVLVKREVATAIVSHQTFPKC